MKNFRKYGKTPFKIAVLHGGPGVSGKVMAVAKELSQTFGVLEPLQTKKSIKEQLDELKKVIEENGKSPVTLVGWSWGAWLGYLFAAKYPSLVEKLVLVSSGPFEQKYAKKVMGTRVHRLNKKEKAQLSFLNESFKNPKFKSKDALFARFGKLLDKADLYAPITTKLEKINVQLDIYQGVWPEAAELRKSGKLLKLGKKIKCPVVAIHGDYDPHPAGGVKKTLSKVIKDFRFILLKNCGHKPWIERYAKDEFYKVLKKEFAVKRSWEFHQKILPKSPA